MSTPAPPSGRARAAAAAGAAVAVLVAAAAALAWEDGSPLVQRFGDAFPTTGEPLFLVLVAAAFAVYLGALWLLSRLRGAAGWRTAAVLAVAVQLIPLGAPLLLSTDAWSYWGYGWISAEAGGNPYVSPPEDFPANPALGHMGEDWVDTTSAYGPAFQLASEPIALASGDSEDVAAWIYKALAGIGAAAAALAVGRVSGRRAFATALVGWNPVLAIHLAGGGHNDAWVGALLAVALALGAVRRRQAAGVFWALAVLVKFVPALFLVMRALEARRSGREVRHLGFALAFALVVGVGAWRYGIDMVRAVRPLAANFAGQTAYALPQRLQQAGIPELAARAMGLTAAIFLLGLLLKRAYQGRARLGLAACTVLATTPYLAVWYLAWAAPLVAYDDDDRLARLAFLALCAYLLPQTIPL